jgi:hypothetical protein
LTGEVVRISFVFHEVRTIEVIAVLSWRGTRHAEVSISPACRRSLSKLNVHATVGLL